MPVPPISQAADDLIIASEVFSRAYYDKILRRPEWPGGASGVTIGIGYDLGYASPAKIRNDWGSRLPPEMVGAMVRCSGFTGSAAHALLGGVRSQIDVPWDKAADVFENIDIPEWTQTVCRMIPGADKLPPDCLGALVSLAYNRGASFTAPGDRYREMRAIRSHIMAGELDEVPAEFRSMKRLWPTVKGLRIRRDEEAKLWEDGLKKRSAPTVQPIPFPDRVPPKPIPSENPPPLEPLPPKTPSSTEAGTTGGGVIVTGGAATAAQHAGMSPWLIALIVIGGIVITIGTVAYIRYRRSQPTLARAKG